MNIYEFLTKNNRVAHSENGNKITEQQKDIKFAYGEAPNLDQAGGFSDFVEGGADPSGSMDMSGGDDFGGGNNDFGDFGGADGGMDDGFGDFQNAEEGNVPKAAIEFLENIDESEVHIVEKLLTGYSNLYHNQLSTYNKLIVQNLETTDFKDSIESIKDQYKRSLAILKSYITDRYEKETTVSRVETFVKFKDIFEKLSIEVNDILDKVRKA